jgi:hypothetical protein
MARHTPTLVRARECLTLLQVITRSLCTRQGQNARRVMTRKMEFLKVLWWALVTATNPFASYHVLFITKPTIKT